MGYAPPNKDWLKKCRCRIERILAPEYQKSWQNFLRIVGLLTMIFWIIYFIVKGF